MNKAKAAYEEHTSSNQQSFAPANQQPQQPISNQDGPENIQSPHPLEVMRYRYQHGTNLGSVFVLERWLTGSMFQEGSGGSAELAAIEGLVKANGIDATKDKFERHWREYCSDEDLDWLVNDAKCEFHSASFSYSPQERGENYSGDNAQLDLSRGTILVPYISYLSRPESQSQQHEQSHHCRS